MKFAKELEEELVPEWRVKYLNYKGGKKKVKAIARALKHVEQTSWTTPARRHRGSILFENGSTYPGERNRPRQFGGYHPTAETQQNAISNAGVAGAPSSLPVPSNLPVSPLRLDPPAAHPRERQPLTSTTNGQNLDRCESYGSIIRSPSPRPRQSFPSSLDLPGPALEPEPSSTAFSFNSNGNGNGNIENGQAHGNSLPANHQRPANASQKNQRFGILPGPNDIFRPRVNSNPDPSRRPILQRLFSSKISRDQFTNNHIPTEAFVEVRIREAEFFTFLDKELTKIEAFYHMKEEEASDRLATLKSQLHLMRDSRTQELIYKKQARDAGKKQIENGVHGTEKRRTFGSSLVGKVGHGKDSSKGSEQNVPRLTVGDESKDYVKRQPLTNVPYRSAKRKLKLALLEFYRGLELLKAYADLNRTAFRKMNKKYDKVTNSRPTGRYMSEKVNKAWFVRSDAVENHLVVVEDLYTRYFERGDRKAAIGKLRGKVHRPQDHSPSAYRNGITCGAGLVLGIQGLVYAVEHLHGDDGTIRTQTSFLLQVYGGYFLILLHFLLFCLDCMVWSASKINYVFVFEFDTRHVLDWRQLAEIPCFFVFLEGLFIWINFRWINSLFIYYPLILIAATVAIVFLPFRTLYHRSRSWWAYSNWRLLWAGFYPVEFRDFFLGDMFCSQTYAMGNIALFFCLYANAWDEPAQCNSSHSRAMGFLTALPAIWRAFQCLRRYRDTKDTFPHIVNFCKYAFSILAAMTLSLYRIGRTHHFRAAFVVCACINAMYTSIWDLAMDWSLGNPHAKHPFLREFLAFRRRWVYYAAMTIDPILRFSWILYIIFTNEVQHSAVLSFIVALLEVGRRGMWSIFRVENEHCTNVCRFRASRDLPLPYDMSAAAGLSPSGRSGNTHVPGSDLSDAPPRTTGVDIERMSSLNLRHRRPSQASEHVAGTLSRVGNMLANAHAQDFERRKDRSVTGKGHTPEGHPRRARDSSTEDEAEEEEEEEEDVEEQIPDLVDYPLYVGNGNLFDEEQGHPHRS